jgi:hypothetical protein
VFLGENKIKHSPKNMSRAREKIKTGKNPQEIVLAIKGPIKSIWIFSVSYGYDLKEQLISEKGKILNL